MGAACGRTRPACGEGARSWAGVGSGAFSREGLRAFGQPMGGVAVGAACRNLSRNSRLQPRGRWKGESGLSQSWGRDSTVPLALGEGAVA